MALIYARHAVYGECLVPESKVQMHPDVWTAIDPNEHTAAEGDRPRPRKTVVAKADDPQTPDAVGAGPTPPSTED